MQDCGVPSLTLGVQAGDLTGNRAGSGLEVPMTTLPSVVVIRNVLPNPRARKRLSRTLVALAAFMPSEVRVEGLSGI